MDLNQKVRYFQSRVERTTESCHTEKCVQADGLIAMSRSFQPASLSTADMEEAKVAITSQSSQPIKPVEITKLKAGDGFIVTMTVSCYVDEIDHEHIDLLIFEWNQLLDDSVEKLRAWDSYMTQKKMIAKHKKAQ